MGLEPFELKLQTRQMFRLQTEEAIFSGGDFLFWKIKEKI